MSHSVTVLTPNGRRQVVKVTLNTSILQILEEACAKQGLSSSDFDLRHIERVLDLSNTVRFSSLPNNAKLEMVKAKNAKVDSKVTIAIQTPSNERVVQAFDTTADLWTVLSAAHDQSGDKIKLESHDEDGNVLEPVLVYMRKEVVGEEQLRTTTLRSLGLTGGNAVIRLLYRNTTMEVEQAHVEAIVFPKPPPLPDNTASRAAPWSASLPVESWDDDDAGPSTSGSGIVNWNAADENVPPESLGGSDQPMVQPVEEATEPYAWPKSAAHALNSDVATDEPEAMRPELDESVEHHVEEKLIYLDDKGSLLYCLDQVDAPVPVELPDSYFEVTVSDIKLLFSELKQRREDLEEGGMLRTRSMRESECLARLKQYPKAIIRVVFPDRLVLQGYFRSISTVAEIFKFVQSFLADDKCDFHLFTTPPKQLLNPEDRLFEVPLAPAAVVYFGCENKQDHYLDGGVLDKISSPRAVQKDSSVTRLSTMNRDQTFGFVEASQQTLVSPRPSTSTRGIFEPRPSTSSASSEIGSSGAVPKWFSVGKK